MSELELDEYGCPISEKRWCGPPDPYIIRGYPKDGYGWRQGETWAIVEREDGFYVECHWRAMWKGGEDSYGCFSTDAKAEKWIRDHVEFEKKDKLRRWRESDLREAKKLTKKWEGIK